MPRVHRKVKERRGVVLGSSHMEHLMLGFSFMDGDDLFERVSPDWRKEVWGEYREQLMAECPAGTRPAAWWDYDAPKEPRKRLGGTGTPIPGCRFRKGVPLAYGEDYDLEDPPRYETEAEYLGRHGLLTETEKEALKCHE